MFKKLDALTDRFRELSEAIAQPEIIQDYPRYQAYLKELVQKDEAACRLLSAQPFNYRII